VLCTGMGVPVQCPAGVSGAVDHWDGVGTLGFGWSGAFGVRMSEAQAPAWC
jgi:hypothetical protein